MRIALDTNVLAYAEGVGDAERCQAAVALIGRLPVEHGAPRADPGGALSSIDR